MNWRQAQGLYRETHRLLHPQKIPAKSYPGKIPLWSISLETPMTSPAFAHVTLSASFPHPCQESIKHKIACIDGETPWEEEKDEKKLQTHLVLKEMEVRGVDERGRRRSCFYTVPAPPQAHSHCTRTLIFLQTHLKAKHSTQWHRLWFGFHLFCHFISPFLTFPLSHEGFYHVVG